MWELDYKECWALKNWCFWTVVLEKALESPLDGKEIQPVNPKGNQSWIVIGRIDAKAETPTLWPPDAKNWLLGKDLHAGQDWGQEEKRTTEDEMIGWYHWLDGHVFEQAPGVGDGQGSLGLQRVRHDWGTELNWIFLPVFFLVLFPFGAFITIYQISCNKSGILIHCRIPTNGTMPGI